MHERLYSLCFHGALLQSPIIAQWLMASDISMVDLDLVAPINLYRQSGPAALLVRVWCLRSISCNAKPSPP